MYFQGYYSKEFAGWAVVGYQDERGDFKAIQKYYNSAQDTLNRRDILHEGCIAEEVENPVQKARDLVTMLNGGRDFGRIVEELKGIRGALEGIADSIGYLHPKT